MLNIFEKYCDKWKLTVNISKTEVLIFFKGRNLNNQKFYFKGTELEVVKEYKYLGIFLSRTGSYIKTKKSTLLIKRIKLYIVSYAKQGP